MCVAVVEDIPKSTPAVPVWNDCVAAVRPLSCVIPPAGAPVWSSSHDKVTTPEDGAEAERTCPAVGVSIGKMYDNVLPCIPALKAIVLVLLTLVNIADPPIAAFPEIAIPP